jgi:hypothetical protein
MGRGSPARAGRGQCRWDRNRLHIRIGAWCAVCFELTAHVYESRWPNIETINNRGQSRRVLARGSKDLPHRSRLDRGVCDFNALHALCKIVQVRLSVDHHRVQTAVSEQAS